MDGGCDQHATNSSVLSDTNLGWFDVTGNYLLAKTDFFGRILGH